MSVKYSLQVIAKRIPNKTCMIYCSHPVPIFSGNTEELKTDGVRPALPPGLPRVEYWQGQNTSREFSRCIGTSYPTLIKKLFTDEKKHTT